MELKKKKFNTVNLYEEKYDHIILRIKEIKNNRHRQGGGWLPEQPGGEEAIMISMVGLRLMIWVEENRHTLNIFYLCFKS